METFQVFDLLILFGKNQTLIHFIRVSYDKVMLNVSILT